MTSRQTTAEKPKYFDLDIHGIGYLNRVREVTPENGFPFSVSPSRRYEGQLITFSTRISSAWWWSEEAKDLVRQLMPAVEADFKVLVGFTSVI